MIDIEKFICSLLADHPVGVTVREDIHKALKDQGLEYKGGKILPIEDKIKLKESEDEIVRKWIINYLNSRILNSSILDEKESCKKALAWIERQCKKGVKGNESEIPNLEQKPTDKVEPKFKIGDTIKCKHDNRQFTIKSVDLDKGTYTYTQEGCGNDIDYADEEFELVEQKPTGKVEPKFKVGDWVVQGYNILKIKCVGDTHYCFETVGGYVDDMLVPEIDSQFHLWTIEDAKDGDILCCESGWTCIFKALDNYANTFSSYCFMDKYKWFCNTGSECHTLDERFVKAYNGEIHPATKEQRDLLFQKMKENDYEWDTKKRELKKIIAPIFNIGDTIIKKHDSNIHDFASFTITDITDEKYWHNDGIICYIIEQNEWELYEPVRQNTAERSEEVTKNEDDMFPNLIQPNKVATPAEEYSFNIESELFQQLTTKEQQGLWKKEIEQAYNAGAEASAEWSEEDEKEFKQLLGILHANGYESFDIWLKSLKEHMQHQ